MDTILDQRGFEIIENVYSEREVKEILAVLESEEFENQFGVRGFLIDHPGIAEKVFSKKLIRLIEKISPACNKSIKSIYFNKPPSANWIVNWHQDLTINVTEKKNVPNFKNWRINKGRITVQPSQEILESIFTIRIHLDDCKKENGALRVIESSHRNGVIGIKKWIKNKKGIERLCEVNKGGILIMKPLILHSSRRTENQKNRRIIHIEFCGKELPHGLNWKERININKEP